MAKVHLFLDTVYSLYMWDEQILDIINEDNHLALIDIPQHLVDKYNTAIKELANTTELLKEYYNEQEAQEHTTISY